ncbi:MAG: hypothetical protein L0Y64_19180, partial [Myxococcaceae bacterium]|nr:hypothetical protein [Myxococcaceae bacterium]
GKDSRVLGAQVYRTSEALDPVLRTLGVQLTLDAPPTDVAAGSYAQVRFEVPRGQPALVLPGATVAVRAGTSTIGVVQADGTLHFRPVKLLRDLGRDVEIEGELQPGVKVALYPSPQLSDGDRVSAVEGKP